MPSFSYALGNSRISVVCEKGPKTKVSQPPEVHAYWKEHLFPLMHNENKEHLWVLALNNHNRITAWELNSLGGIASTVADIRTIFQFLLINGATAFLNICFQDHLIVSPDAFYSLRQAGLVSCD